MNFNSKEIIFVFDEFIKSVTKNKVVVNPYLPNNMYDISPGKKLFYPLMTVCEIILLILLLLIKPLLILLKGIF